MFLRFNLLGLMWAVVVGVLYGMPSEKLPHFSIGDLIKFDKLAHTFIFSVLVLLLIVGFKKQYSIGALRLNPIGVKAVSLFSDPP